ncbi:hypothetical protein [Nostoc sp.]|uniref:hypothetical protein n=1 Tax=Nostoc sp. TaxID=1180 RepID=UPI003FA54535
MGYFFIWKSLKQTNSNLVQQNTFTIARTRHEFTVIRLWEQPIEVFLRTPGLLPLAVLSSTIEQCEMTKIGSIRSVRRRSPP